MADAALRTREQRHRQRGHGSKPDSDPAHLRVTASDGDGAYYIFFDYRFVLLAVTRR